MSDIVTINAAAEQVALSIVSLVGAIADARKVSAESTVGGLTITEQLADLSDRIREATDRIDAVDEDAIADLDSRVDDLERNNHDDIEFRLDDIESKLSDASSALS